MTPSVGAHGVRCRATHAAYAAHPVARTYPGFPAWLAAQRADTFNTVFVDKVGCREGGLGAARWRGFTRAGSHTGLHLA